MTKLEQMTKKAIISFVEKETSRVVTGVRHIYPRAYVLSRCAPSCLLIACPPQDAEQQIKGLNKLDGYKNVDGGEICRLFDDSLKAGDWCSVAYVSSAGIGETVAVKAV